MNAVRPSSQDLNVKEAEQVTLVGTFVQEYHEELSPSSRRDLQWLGESLLLVGACFDANERAAEYSGT